MDFKERVLRAGFGLAILGIAGGVVMTKAVQGDAVFWVMGISLIAAVYAFTGDQW